LLVFLCYRYIDSMEKFLSDSESKDAGYMRLALDEANKAAAKGEVPVGAVVVYDNEVIGRGYNRREELRSAMAHAEMLALEQASSHIGRWRLGDCQIYVTLEPCVMCVGAILQARLGQLVFGCLDPKGGAVESLYQLCNDGRLNHRLPVTGGILAADCAAILADFFTRLRQDKRDQTKSGEVAEPG
jgi:tRNA(adenine34) deaminase